MKTSKSERKRIFILSPNSSSNRGNMSIQTDRLALPGSLKSNTHPLVFSDPFREICKGMPNSRLKPILLKKRLSPCPNLSLHPSLIRCPDVIDSQCLNLNKYSLPKIQFPLELRIKNTKKMENCKGRANSERILRPSVKDYDCQARKNSRVFANKNLLEVSFGVQN